MFTKNKRISLLSYWTSRYVMTLVVGLAVVFILSILWVRHTTLQYNLDMMEFIADDTMDRLVNPSTNEPPNDMPGFLEGRERPNFRDVNPTIYLTDTKGEVVTTNRPFPDGTVSFDGLVDQQDGVYKDVLNDEPYYIVQRQIVLDDEVVGTIFVVERKVKLVQVEQEFGQILFLLVVLGLLGWCAIYFQSKRLARPIKGVAYAAKMVQEGNYNITLPTAIKEEEVYELVSSFKEMASRLQQLEKTRTELLAGVTHELQTPVTSISGLLQAVQDEVVKDEQAGQFITMALQETTKMKTMVGDLLAFNAFAVDAVPVNLQVLSVQECLAGILSRWKIGFGGIELQTIFPEQPLQVEMDQVRFEQIMTNLLTNAAQAMQSKGVLQVSLTATLDAVKIRVQDEGTGIPANEQSFIFERFYRGENKKYTVRGLGLGLPLSKMMANSIGGDLQLVESNENGTTFELALKIAE